MSETSTERFTVAERLLLLPLLQIGEQGADIITVRIQDDLERELGFTEQEVADLNLRHEGENVLWDLAADPNKEIAVGPVGLRIIVETLQRASNMHLLRKVHLPLWNRFVGLPEAQPPAAGGPVAVQ